jgi:hypothetical protein
MDRDDGIAAIVLAAEHLLDLAGLYLAVERIECLAELALYGFPGIGPFLQDGKVVASLSQRRDQLAIQLQTPAALQDALRLGLILPEVRGRNAGFETRQFFVESRGFKDSSADPQPAG